MENEECQSEGQGSSGEGLVLSLVDKADKQRR